MIERNEQFHHAARLYGVPEHDIEALEFYVYHRIEPGSFLRSVLENDLKGAIGRADHINSEHLREIVMFMYQVLPAQSQGSPEKVHNWLHPNAVQPAE